MPVVAELRVFSGRPNPAISLTAAEVAEMEARMSGLPASPPLDIGGGLGYSGIAVMDASKGTDLEVFQGVVLDRQTNRYWQDEKGLEKWLLRKFSERGYGIADSLLIE